MSETTLWLYDLTDPQLVEAKALLRALLRPTDNDTALLHIIEIAGQPRRYDLCLTLEQGVDEIVDVVSILARTLRSPFECTHFGEDSSLWRYISELGLHHVHLDAFGSPCLSEAFLQEAIATSRSSGLILAGAIRRALGTQYDDVLEAFRVRSGSAKTRSISLAS